MDRLSTLPIHDRENVVRNISCRPTRKANALSIAILSRGPEILVAAHDCRVALHHVECAPHRS